MFVEEEFKIFLEDFKSGKYENPLQIPPEIWGLHGWETLDRKTVHEIFLPLIRWQVARAAKAMPLIYKKAYEEKQINAKKIETIEDFWNIPALTKDASVQGFGFRDKVRDNPDAMLPSDVNSATCVYKSGGTRGVATPTYITCLDREIESHALKRCFEYMGFKKSTSLSTYNPTHKGGELIKEALMKMGIKFVPRRTTDSVEETLRTIKSYGVKALATVQGPIQEGDKTRKGGGVDFFSLVESGEKILEQNIDILFITGYILIPELIEWAEAKNKNLATTLGSSEAIPQATSTNLGKNRLCKHNNMHLLNGPHYVEILKEEGGILVPVKKGEEGILAYTTVAREGTIYIRYFPGDAVLLSENEGKCPCGIKSEIISGVHRIDIPEDVVEAGCCIG